MAIVDLQNIIGNTTFASGFSGVSGYSGIGNAYTVIIVSGTSQLANNNEHYIITNVAATTITLPDNPNDGDIIWVTVVNGLNSNIIARNGKSIQGLAEDLTIDIADTTVRLRYINSTYMWRII